MENAGLRQLTVMVVEDSAVVRERLQQMVETSPVVGQVHEAATGAEAWVKFQIFKPEVVLLDLQLPDTSGLEVLGRIKQMAPTCQLIILTNLRDPWVRRECQRRGASRFLHKPSEFDQVVDILRECALKMNNRNAAISKI